MIGERLAGARDGHGATILVEGRAGFGKSRLLEEASKMAGRLDMRVGVGAAEPGDHVVPMGSLIAALFEPPAPLLGPGALTDLHALPEQRYWLLQEIESLLEHAALEAPLLVCLDDLQWADGGTVAAVRALPARLTALPIVWLAAFRAGEAPAHLHAAAGRLEQIGAQRLRLGPLDEAAVAQVVGDTLQAEPDPGLLEVAETARGNPFLLVELLLGLLEEGLARVESGRAELLEARLPVRVRDTMRDRLERMSEPARQAACVASVLGRSFSFNDLATMLDLAPSALLPPVDELLRADILSEDGERLEFRHDILREAVLDSLPASARRALQRQAVDVLLEAGALPVEVAAQLAASAEPGDEVAIATLLKAAEALGSSDPGAAADLGMRALELAPRDAPIRGPLVGETALLLHAAGRVAEGKAFADGALGDMLTPEQEAEVRLGITGMFSLSPDVRIENGRIALRLPGLPEPLRARHLARLVHNLTVAGRPDEAREIVGDAQAAVRSSGDATAAFTLELAEAGLEYTHARFGPSLEHIEAAARRGTGVHDDPGLRMAEQWRSELLAVHDRCDEALRVATDGLAAAQRDHQGWALWLWEWWRGRQLLQVGRLPDAAAALEARLVADENPPISGALDAAALVALGRVALHRGDAHQTRNCASLAEGLLETGPPAVRRHAAWLLALQAMARGDAPAAHEHLSALGHDERTTILPLFPLDVCDEPQLVRIAIAAGDEELAASGGSSAEERLRLNPGVATIAAVAAHARGLLRADDKELAAAVELFEGGPRPLALASALEDHGRGLVERGRRDEGIGAFGRALELYARAGATWDARRVRGRLRALGIRRRLASPERPAGGWGALTESELDVVRLVTEGLTNREAAERLFLSPHTVSTHLRHAFTKLGINSRVELARMALEHDRTGDPV